MTDNQLIEIFLPIINAGLIADGFTGVQVKQLNQPTQQGINTAPTVYFSKVGDHRYGFLRRSDQWDSKDEEMTHTEEQFYETTFQIMALVLQDPANISYTASDLANEVAAIMQSDTTVDTLGASNVGILRVTDIINPFEKDDRDQFEAFPSFDFTLTHSQIRTSTVPIVNPITTAIYPI
jgi:hypothetical protein